MLQAECEGGAGCRWCYTGQGWHYQLLAGPGFIVVFTIAGVAWGFLADRCGYNINVPCQHAVSLPCDYLCRLSLSVPNM